jgi:hypothetical protein
MLSGATRMTFALAVVMLETTASLELFLPIIFTLFVAHGTGVLLVSKSIYLAAIRSKNIPILLNKSPPESKLVLANQIMSTQVVSMRNNVSVREAYQKLSSNSFNGYPVVNEAE